MTSKKNQTAYLYETKDGDPKDFTLMFRLYDKQADDKLVLITVALEYPS